MLTFLIEKQKAKPGRHVNSPVATYWARVGTIRAKNIAAALNKAGGLYNHQAGTRLRVSGIQFHAR